MKDRIYEIAPHAIQNFLISIFNFFAYKKRYGGIYNKYLEKFKKNKNLSLKQLSMIQETRFEELIDFSRKNSKFYSNIYEDITEPVKLNTISRLPIVDKEMLRKNIKDVYTIEKQQGIVSKTGGTTGKAIEGSLYMKIICKNVLQCLDNFRNRYGYKLGKKTAWFSGKVF